ALAILQKAARPRSMTVNSFGRLLLELLAKEKAFLDQLLDDDLRAERHEALPLEDLSGDPRPNGRPTVCSHEPPVADAAGSEVALIPAQPSLPLVALFQPQLEGRMG